jgi:hypothetical protein
MYTLEQLQGKSLAELKEIASMLNVLPAADRRFRQSWIDAIAGVNPPLLQLLEVSPAASVEQFQEAIEPVAETSPSVGVDRVQDIIDQTWTSWEKEHCAWLKMAKWCIHQGENKRINAFLPASKTLRLEGMKKGAEYCAIWEVSECTYNFNGLPLPVCTSLYAQEAIIQAAEISPGVDVDPAESAPECVECFDDGLIDQESGFIKFCHCSSGTTLSRQKTQRAIAPAAKNPPGVEADYSPAVTGITFSRKFLATYPPYFGEIHYKADCTGQLNLLESAETENEPPDPDDFASLDAFRDEIALWDAQNPESPTVSIDSMCEWAPCPEEWYEPKAEILPLKASSMIELPEQSEVMELSITDGSSITCNFSIPTFGAWCDRSNRSDEPPDTGIFAKSPKPKPPKFPPQVASQSKAVQVDQASRNYPETIPTLFHRVAAGSSTQPARHRGVMRCPKRHYLREGLDNFSSQNQTPRSSFFKAGDRFLLKPSTIRKKSMTVIL